MIWACIIFLVISAALYGFWRFADAHSLRVPEHVIEVRGEPFRYIVEPTASFDTAVAIVAGLPTKCCLVCFDATDPVGGVGKGAYYTLLRDEFSLQMTGGNSHWSYGRTSVTAQDAAAFIFHCFPSNRGPHPHCLSTQRMSPSQWERLDHDERLDQRIAEIAAAVRKESNHESSAAP